MAACLPLGCRKGERSERPNLVLILTDDQETGSLAHMPVVQKRLVRRGMTFASAFATTPLCCPSRASILTGQYIHNHRVYANQPPEGGAPRFAQLGHEANDLAVWLQAAGYRTGIFGKYLNAYEDPRHVPPGWNDWHVAIGREGYNGFNYTLSENGRPVRYGENDDDYITSVLADRAVAFVRAAEKDDRRPFFIYFSTFAPHGPYVSARKDRKAFRRVTAPRPPSFNEADMRDKPAYMQALPLDSPLIREIDRLYRRYLRSLLGVDRAVDRILDALDCGDETRDTYVFYFSDNGTLLGEHRDVGKWSPYEESIHVPLVVRGPGVPAGSVSRKQALNLDLAPTFLAIAGARAGAPMDGRSLLPILRGSPPPDWRTDFLIENLEGLSGDPHPRKMTDPPPYRGVRTERYLYVEYLDPRKGTRELYDLNRDPYELESLHARPETQPLMRRLSARVRALQECRGDDCRRAAADASSTQGGNTAVTGDDRPGEVGAGP